MIEKAFSGNDRLQNWDLKDCKLAKTDYSLWVLHNVAIKKSRSQSTMLKMATFCKNFKITE